MTIPLSLIGQILLNSQTASWIYWLGACVVVLSFIFVNQEETKEEETSKLQLSAQEAPVDATSAT